VTAVTASTATFDVDSAAAFGVVSIAGELDAGSIAMTLTDSTAVVFSIEASPAADLGAGAVAGGFGATGFFVSSRADAVASSGSTIASGAAAASGRAIASGGALVLATSTRSEGWRAAISTATTKTPISPRRIARGLVDGAGTEVARTGNESVARVAALAPVARTGFFALFARFALFAGMGILRSESLRSLRSALSTYRIDRGGFGDPFTRTMPPADGVR
jgi:hypothetical protein